MSKFIVSLSSVTSLLLQARDAGDLSSDEDVDQRQPSAKDDDDGNMFDPAKAAECKEQGNKYFKAGEYRVSFDHVHVLVGTLLSSRAPNANYNSDRT